VKEVQRVESGEEYAICCPKCGDTRFRLNISYVFGEVIDGVPMNHTVHCWNENCDVASFLLRHYEEFCDIMEEDLKPVDVEENSGPLNLMDVVKTCQENLMVVEGIQRVDTLDEDHPACRYLRSRSFDPQVVGKRYGVGYCENEDYNARMAHKRLIIPVLFEHAYVGWQSRAIEGLTQLKRNDKKLNSSWPYFQPKYWTSTGSKVSSFLYSYDLAATQDSVYVMEGPTDAWRAGPCGVSVFGRRISVYQRTLIAETWSDKPGKIVLIGDPGFEDDWRRNYEMLSEEVGEPGKVKLILPRDKDPGDMTREELESYVADVQ
jgi:hypothetical protein